MVCQTIARERGNLAVMPELQQALSLISQIPEYQSKIQRTKRIMEATTALIAKTEKQVATLREKTAEAVAHSKFWPYCMCFGGCCSGLRPRLWCISATQAVGSRILRLRPHALPGLPHGDFSHVTKKVENENSSSFSELTQSQRPTFVGAEY